VTAGDIGGAFENSGAITTVLSVEKGIDIGGAVGNGFTNSGAINASGQGILIQGQITGNFLNNTGGSIVSENDSAILLDAAGTSLTGNFTNNADLEGDANGVRIDGAVGGSFTNTGAISAGITGIGFSGTVGNGITNSGAIGTSVERVGSRGIQALGVITGDVLIDTGGDIYSSSEGIFMPIGGVNGNFTNNATIDSLNETGVSIFAFGGTLDGDFTNNGTISGEKLGVEIGSLEAGHTFENTGSITGTTDDGVQITLSGAGASTLTNSGTITGGTRAVEIIGGGIAFNNTGTLNGNVVLGAASSGDNGGNVQNRVTLNDSGVINGLLDVGTSTATTVTFTGTGSAMLSTEVTGGINSGATTNTINGSLAKEGTGTWTIDEDLAAGQGTTVTAGTVLVAGGSTLTSNVQVDGGTLGGSGIIDGNVSLGGTLSPGNSPGALTVSGDFAFEPTSDTLIELDSLVSFDQLLVGGALTYGGDILFDFSFVPTVGQSFDIFDFSSQSGMFNNINFANAGYDGTFDYGTGTLSLTAIPEPSAALLALLALAAAFALAPRRRRA